MRLVRPAAVDDFAISQNTPYGQVLVLPSQRLVHPTVDDDFVIYLHYHSAYGYQSWQSGKLFGWAPAHKVT